MWLEVLARVDWAGLNFVEPAADSAKLGGHDIPTGDWNVHIAAVELAAMQLQRKCTVGTVCDGLAYIGLLQPNCTHSDIT